MSTLTAEKQATRAQAIKVSADSLVVDLSDGRTITAPLPWFPRLAHGTSKERNHWRLVGGGGGMHWPSLDEDISVENLLAGKRSGESPRSFKAWLEQRESRGRKLSQVKL